MLEGTEPVSSRWHPAMHRSWHVSYMSVFHPCNNSMGLKFCLNHHPQFTDEETKVQN